MASKVELDTVDSVPTDARVGHYDELGEAAKERLPTLAAAEGATEVEERAGRDLAAYEFVKFTDYYRVQRVA